MFKRELLKQSKFKRILLKLLNVYAYDKETLNLVNPNYDNYQKNIIKFNERSLNFSRGHLNLSRKIKKLDIYYRYSPQNFLWNSSKSAKRIIQNVKKEKLISICLLSLKESILNFVRDKNFEVSLNLIGDNSNSDFDNHLSKIVKSNYINVSFFKSKIKGNRGSYLECCDQALNSEDIIFFVEDDYLFETNCVEEMILSYSRISSLLKEDVVMCPSDYPFFYDSSYTTTLHLGNNYKWRNVGETLLTFMFSKEIFNKYNNLFRLVGNQVNDPFERPLHDIYKNVNCIAPVGSLSHHISRHVPVVSNEDWLTTWNNALKNYESLNLSSDYS